MYSLKDTARDNVLLEVQSIDTLLKITTLPEKTSRIIAQTGYHVQNFGQSPLKIVNLETFFGNGENYRQI